MSQIEKFWKQVALDIEEDYQKGHPSNWSRDRIDHFLIHLEDCLVEKCKKEPECIKLLNIPIESGQAQYHFLKVPSYSTFLRIFKNKTSTGKKFSRNAFAIYLGYRSFDDYISANGLDNLNDITQNSDAEVKNKDENSEERKLQKTAFISNESQKKVFIEKALLEGYKWMIFWLAGSSLIHNIIGTIKDITDNTSWYYTFYLPPILIGFLVFSLGKRMIKKGDDKIMLLSIVWWFAIVSQISINQFIPGFLHVIEAGSIFVIGIIGQIGLSTRLIFITQNTKAVINQHHQFITLFKYNLNIVLFTYFIGLFFGLLLATFVWIIPTENFETHLPVEVFRLLRTIEIIIGMILISIGFRKLVFKPVLFLNTH